MEKLFNFVYITTNLLNGKQYVGDHSCNDLEKDNYLGSGNFNNALRKYGRANFKRKELEFFSTKQEAFNAQEKYIKEYNTLSPNGYNISPTGGFGVKGFLSEESKRKIGDANRNNLYWLGKHHTPESKKKISEHTNVKGDKNPFYHKHHTEQTKNILRQKSLNVIKIKCDYCKKKFTPAMFVRWHGEKCKLNSN
jgi:group I intron endonuclease